MGSCAGIVAGGRARSLELDQARWESLLSRSVLGRWEEQESPVALMS